MLVIPERVKRQQPIRTSRFFQYNIGSSDNLTYISPGIINAIILPQKPPKKWKNIFIFGKKIAKSRVETTMLKVIP